MGTFWITSLLFWTLVGRAEDLDRTRVITEGQTAYTGERLAVGTTVRAFVVRYPGRAEWSVSPSRYAVQFDTGTFKFRNAEAHPVQDNGAWFELVFRVHGVSETAVETPKGSNNWGWHLTYECELLSAVQAD